MRALLLGAVAVVALNAGGSAHAADLPVKAPVHSAPAPAVYNWTGFYLGGGFGYGMFNLDSSLTDGGAVESDNVTSGGKGWFGTVVAGFDYRFSDRFVAGVFADWDFSNIKGHIGDPWWEESGSIKQQWAWSAGGRLGYLVTPAVLSYVNGGFTQSRFSQANLSDFGLGAGIRSFMPAQTYNGWFLGGGLEAMVPGFPGWVARSEYRFADYGSRTVPVLPGDPSGTFDRVHPYVQTIRTDLIYKFNWGKGPVAAYAALPTPVAYNWTGFYLGGGFGYGMFNLDSSITQNGNLVSANQTLGGRGWFGTALAGFDYQFSDRIVAGAFADWDFSNIKGHWSDPYWEEGGSIKQQWAWAVGARLGYLITPAALSYVNGGFTQAHFSQVNFFDFGILSRPEPDTLPAQTYSGWFLGGGLEVRLPNFPGWSVKTEYRFADYRAKDVPILNQPSAAFDQIHPYVQTIRTDLVYKFDWGKQPVVAKY